MNHTAIAPGGQPVEGWVPRPRADSARGGFPRPRGYHGPRSAARGVKVYANTPFGLRVAGLLVEDGEGRVVFRRQVRTDRHLLRVPTEAWAFDRAVLDKAEAAGATLVEVVDEAGRVWRTPLVYLLERGESLDRGHGRQTYLALRLWSFLPADSAARQLALAGEARP